MKNPYLLVLFALLLAFSSVQAQTPNIYFDVVNSRTVAHPTLGTSTAVDVMMYADQSGTYHSRGQVYLSYNTARFGTSINLNNNLAFTHGTLLSDQVNFLGMLTPFYNTINVIDNQEDVVVLTWLSNFINALPNPGIHTAVPTTPTLLYTIYFKIQNSSAAANIQLYTQNMIGQQFYITNVGGTPTEIPYGNGFLPVELLDFQADKLNGQRVKLSWATSMEVNNDHFVIEKSHSNGDFFPVGQIEGAGTSDEVNTYAFVDESSMDIVNYYRLKQVDLDGTVKYSDAVNVHFDLNLVQVYPSPTQGEVSVKYVGEMTGEASIKVMDLSGKVMMNSQHRFTSSNEVISLDFSQFADGMYIVQVNKPNGTIETSRITKMK